MAAKKRILIVDDQQLQLDLMQGILEEKYQVECCLDGASCLLRYEKSPADVVLLDVEMPGMGGLEVCRRLLKIAPQCPIMFISSLDTNEDRLAGYTSGGYDYMVKPFVPDELLAKLEVIIQQQEQKQQCARDSKEIHLAFRDALKGSSELGILIRFAVNAFEVKSYKELAEAIAETLEDLGGLNASFFVGGGQQEEYFWSCTGPCPPMDVEVLAMLQDKGRLFEFQNQLQMNVH